MTREIAAALAFLMLAYSVVGTMDYNDAVAMEQERHSSVKVAAR